MFGNQSLLLISNIDFLFYPFRYMKYLYPYECEKRRLSTPAELQAAIDGNRREGRRSSYGQYDTLQRSPNPSQMSPLSLVSQQQQIAARMSSIMSGGISHHNGAHHPSHPQPLGQPVNGGPLPGLAPSEFEARMMEYVKLLNKEIRSSAATTPPRQSGDTSPPSATSPLNPLEMSRMTLWNLYNNNQPQIEPQKEALNLSDPSPMSILTNNLQHHQQQSNNNHVVKRESESRDSPPPAKKFVKEDDEAKGLTSATTHIKIDSRGKRRFVIGYF